MPVRLFAVFLFVLTAQGAVTRVYVTERIDYPAGKIRYERITARAHFAIDPKAPANRIITDIDYAPTNEKGLVEFSADLVVLKPTDPAEGNGTILFEVSNRGNIGSMRMFDFASGPLEAGDRFVLDRGFTMVWLGWQPDVPKDLRLLRLDAPVATDHGKPITGLVRSDIALTKTAKSASLADRGHIAYPVLNPDDPTIQLTVRDLPEGVRRPVPRSQWQFAREENGKPVADPASIYMESGFQAGKIYEIVYTAKDPWVVGLGPAAIRDFISFLKRGGPETLLSDQRAYLKRAIGFGTSQSGRFLRTFLYYGFNADERGRPVFDGVWAHVGGAGRGSFNHRFAQPSRDGHPMLNFFYPTDIFPFTDLDETDSLSGITDGLLDRAAKDNVVPKIFYTNGAYEYWGRAAAMIHVSPDGKADAPLAKDTRIYFLAGTQHGPGAQPVKSITQNIPNPSDYRWNMRALLVAMNEWLTNGAAPPDSAYPKLADGSLARPSELRFPKLPGVQLPTQFYHAWRVDYGPQFRTAGIVTQEPPKVGEQFPALMPQVDADGNEIAGVRAPELAVPLATYTGWNLRDPKIGAPQALSDMIGSMIPLAKTKAERQKTGDLRPSIEERYSGKQDYLDKVTAAAGKLAAQRLLIESDIPAIRERASARWDAVAGK